MGNIRNLEATLAAMFICVGLACGPASTQTGTTPLTGTTADGGTKPGGGTKETSKDPKETQPTCNGSWILGETPLSGSTNWGACNKTPPTNCRGGMWIEFVNAQGATTDCQCIIPCSKLVNKKVGDSCDTNNATQCQDIKSTVSDNSAKACVMKSWNLCQSSTTPATNTNPPPPPPPTCRNEGATCSSDADCCSDSCGADDVCE